MTEHLLVLLVCLTVIAVLHPYICPQQRLCLCAGRNLQRPPIL
jgi:hypothetical protein